MFADSTWHWIIWVWSIVLCSYLILQVLAIWRSAGEVRKRSQSVLIAMVVVTTIQDWIQSAFENKIASRISMSAVGVFAAAATFYLVSLLRSRAQGTSGHPAEDRMGR